MRVWNWFAAGAVVALTATGVAGDESMWVTARQGEIKQRPRGSARTLREVPFGTEVNALERNRRWWTVEFQGVRGFMYSGSLGDEEPDEDPSLVAEDGSHLSSEEVDASSAVRGVGPTATKYANSNEILPEHRTFLDYHQSFVVSDREITELPPNREVVTAEQIEDFMREGGLGPYAE
jgi:hypothetical protein